MNFFSKFPLSSYEFSDKEKTVITDLFRYVSAEDKKLDGIINYTYYSVPEGMRPDVLSSKLYGTPDFHWTFFIINTALKQAGLSSWPKGIAELENFIFEKYMKYGVIEMNSKTIPYTYTFYDVINNIKTITNTTITTKSLNGIALDSDIDVVSLDKRYKSQVVSYKDDRVIVNKNTISSLSFSPNNDIYWNLPKIKLISDEGYNAEVSFKFSDSVHGQGSILSDQITVLNRGENYFTAPQVVVDESAERECIFSFNFTDYSNAWGLLTINYPGKNYCRTPKVIFKTPSIAYTSEPLTIFEIDSSKNYGLKVSAVLDNERYVLPKEITLPILNLTAPQKIVVSGVPDTSFNGVYELHPDSHEGYPMYTWDGDYYLYWSGEYEGEFVGWYLSNDGQPANPVYKKPATSDPVTHFLGSGSWRRMNNSIAYSLSIVPFEPLPQNTNLYSAELTNRDKPLNTPVVYVSNSYAIDENLATFTLQNNSLDILKALKWDIDLLTWISNNRIDIISTGNNTITSTDLNNFQLTKTLSTYIYTILKAIKDKASDASIRLTVGEMATYFIGTIYAPLANEILKVFNESGIDFDSQDGYLTSNENIYRLFYDGLNYENKIEGSPLGISEGWDIPIFFYRRGIPATAPVFSLQNLYGPYTLPSGLGSILFGNETIAVQTDTWNNKQAYISQYAKWYSFKVKRTGNNAFGIFNIFTDQTDVRQGGIGIKLSSNTVFDSIENADSQYIHTFNNGDAVTILGKFQPLIYSYPSAILNTIWFNPNEALTESQLGASSTRRSINRYLVKSNGTEDLEQKLSGMGFDGNTGFIIDEIRIGETFESVTKNPLISVPEIKNYLGETAENMVIAPIIQKLVFGTQSVHGDAQDATHHYEDSAGNQLSYYTGVNNLNGAGNAKITNFEYEVALNDQRREIKIVRPEYIKQFDSIYNTLINS